MRLARRAERKLSRDGLCHDSLGSDARRDRGAILVGVGNAPDGSDRGKISYMLTGLLRALEEELSNERAIAALLTMYCYSLSFVGSVG
jgi:hypothetical protein